MKFHDYSSRITLSAGMKMSCDTEKPTLAYVINRLCRIVTLSFFPPRGWANFSHVTLYIQSIFRCHNFGIEFLSYTLVDVWLKEKVLNFRKSKQIKFWNCVYILWVCFVFNCCTVYCFKQKKLFNMFIYHEAYLTCGMLGKQVLVVTSICKWVTHSLRCRHCGD